MRIPSRAWSQGLGRFGLAATLGAMSLLAACQPAPPPIVIRPANQPAGMASSLGATSAARPMYQMDAQHTGRSPVA